MSTKWLEDEVSDDEDDESDEDWAPKTTDKLPRNPDDWQPVDGVDTETQYEIDDNSKDEGYVYIRSNSTSGLGAGIEEVRTRDDDDDDGGEWIATDNLNIDEEADSDDPTKYTIIMEFVHDEDPDEEDDDEV